MSKKALAVLLAVLNAFDAVSTYLAVVIGPAIELNPLMDALIRFSPALFLLFKLGFGSFIIFFAHQQLDDRRFKYVMALPLVMYLVVLVNNSYALFVLFS